MSSNDMSLKKTLHDLDDHDIHCKKVLVRVDFNVPLDERQNVADDTRIIMALPTINYLRDRKAKIILMSHLGRPKGHYNSKYSLQPVAEYMSKELRLPVSFAEDCIGEEAHKKADALLPGEILILENLRFHPEEESNDPAFAKELASMADIYVNDAFGTAHRSHASTEGVAHLLPACAGLLMEKEIIS
ncbi:MAG: phosphoglycerate kinase, partial [Clostridiales bacterium]